MIIVRLNFFERSCISANTSFPVLVSKFPVGSSAKIMAGLLIRARAIATRCC